MFQDVELVLFVFFSRSQQRQQPPEQHQAHVTTPEVKHQPDSCQQHAGLREDQHAIPMPYNRFPPDLHSGPPDEET